MKMKVDMDELGRGSERVDHRVGVRFGFLVREGHRLSSQQINDELSHIAVSSDIGASLSDIIRNMVSGFAYRDARLSLPEFINRFKENKLSEVITTAFVENLVKIDQDEHLRETTSNGPVTVRPMDEFADMEDLRKKTEAAYMDVLLSTLEYLGSVKLTSAATVYKFLAQKKVERPMVNIQDLFTMEYEEVSSKKGDRKTSLKEKVIAKIEEGFEEVAATAYQEMFEEDRRGFVMGYLMGRVFKYDAEKKKMVFDVFELRALMNYLDSIGADINDINGKTLYDLLYEENQFMTKYVLEQMVGALRFGVREDVAEVGVLDVFDVPEFKEPVIFEQGFDVKVFYDKYIKSELFKFYSKKQSKVTPIREVDLLKDLNNPNTIGRNENTVYMYRFAKTLVDTYHQNPAVFMLKVRELLGLVKAPYVKELTDEQVEQHFQHYFEVAEEKFRVTIKDALYFRVDKKIFDFCKYPEEILKCRDLSKLLEWFVNPALFREDCPGNDDFPNDQIAFMCSAFLRDFLRVVDEMSKKSFIEAERERDVLEQEMVETLNIRKIKDLELSFRNLAEIDDNGQLLNPRNFDVVVGSESIADFVEGHDNNLANHLLSSPDVDSVMAGGKKFRAYPEETKKFKLVEMTIPIVSLDPKARVYSESKSVKVRALIYSGDDHYIHVKDALTRVITMDRGKKVTDEKRWLLCFPDAASLGLFKEFMYSRSPAKAITVEDLDENRKFSKKAVSRDKAASAKRFKKSQDFKMTGETNITEPTLDGTLQSSGIVLETQGFKALSNLLIGSLSQYTEASHDEYRSRRAWPLLFTRYFPPYIFGDKYKAFNQQGHDYVS